MDGFFYTAPDNTATFGYKDYVDICLNPYFGIESDNWNLRLGVLGHFDIGISDVMISPDVRFDWSFTQHSKLYITATGDVRHNSNLDMLTINRYVDPTVRVEHTKEWLITEIGVRTQPVTAFWFDVNTGYDIIEDEDFSVPVFRGYAWHNVGEPLAMDAKKFHVGGALNYQILNNLSASAKVKWNSWKVSNKELEEEIGELSPYGKPTLEIGAGMAFNPIPKLLLELNYDHLGGRHTKMWQRISALPPYSFFGEYVNKKMKNINDLNLKGTYTFNDTFSLYAKANNLLFQEYELWWGYPVQGFNFQIGGAVNF
jgi:hypothetical protein